MLIKNYCVYTDKVKVSNSGLSVKQQTPLFLSLTYFEVKGQQMTPLLNDHQDTPQPQKITLVSSPFIYPVLLFYFYCAE